jgi:hypothetical protein
MRNGRRVATAVVVAALAFVGGYAYRLTQGGAAPRLAISTITAPPPSSTTTTTVEPRDYGAIALVGDSLSVQASLDEQARLLQAGWTPITHNAQFGRRVPWDAKTRAPFSGIAAANEVRADAGDPETWIVELGTNDVAETQDDAGSIRTLIDAMLAVIGPGHRIVWVNVHNGFEPAASATFNRVLDQIAAQRTDLVVADWASQATQPGYLLSDHIHLTNTGQAAFATVIARAADRVAALP